MFPTSVPEPTHVDEPEVAAGYAAVLSQVAEQGQPVIVRRGGEDLAAVIPLEHLELMQDLIARREAERLGTSLNWPALAARNPPPQDWFEGDEPKHSKGRPWRSPRRWSKASCGNFNVGNGACRLWNR